ncbi:hypothetical protein [Pseudomonas avellanae]|uniref:hypothetical protein n=1 Tax=Pseudomonas avellanae TaxID=46257 RepID=UPI001186C28B|nr:hypothetical protein [Pseudomonas avellanae]
MSSSQATVLFYGVQSLQFQNAYFRTHPEVDVYIYPNGIKQAHRLRLTEQTDININGTHLNKKATHILVPFGFLPSEGAITDVALINESIPDEHCILGECRFSVFER